jgi:predicted dehydrogenase
VPAYAGLGDCLRETRPDFVVTATPRAVTPGLVAELVERGFPVLAETPPAADHDGIRRLWRDVGASGLVQVAEQYLLMPTHSARRAVVEAGLIGLPTQVQVSSTQLYHAVSLMRGMLGAGRHPVTVRAATRHTMGLVDPLGRGGWTDDHRVKEVTTTIATLEFGPYESGLYDFTDNQTRNQLRSRRLLIRGSHGELQDEQITRLAKERTITRTRISRNPDGDLSLDGVVLFRNPFKGLRLNDDEIATARLLWAMADWVRGEGPAPYPLAEGLHDLAVGLAIEEAAATGVSAFGGFGEGG